jgi:hypothetical protein
MLQTSKLDEGPHACEQANMKTDEHADAQQK